MTLSIAEREGETLRLRLHPGQVRAWHSPARFIAVLAGTQGGKTSYGPWHIWHKIYGGTDANGEPSPVGGDYLAVTSSYDLFKLKMLPCIREVFEHILQCGRYWNGDRIMELRDPATGQFWANRAADPMWGRIILRSAESQSGLESTTARGAWLDEAGQPSFTVDAWQAILRRLSLSMGWALITTTLYNFGWLKSEVYDRWQRGEDGYEIVHFDSTENPAFPEAEFERARASMPLWKFNMQYRGRFERPAGLIYDAFSDDHITPPFAIPAGWKRYMGLDFGGVNTAAVYYAEEPETERLYLYREYKAGGRTAKEHVRAMLAGEPGLPAAAVGGAMSEGQWRDEFKAAGLPVREPAVSDVEVGIGRVYAAHKLDQIRVFSTCEGYLQEKRAYSRKLDSQGLPTEEIENKNTYHWMDSERYIVGWLRDTRDYTLHVAPNPFGVRRESPGPAREHGTRPPTRKRMRI